MGTVIADRRAPHGPLMRGDGWPSGFGESAALAGRAAPLRAWQCARHHQPCPCAGWQHGMPRRSRSLAPASRAMMRLRTRKTLLRKDRRKMYP